MSRQKATPINTNDLCSYGCGNKAFYMNRSNRLMCSPSPNSCPANKRKNADAIKIAHSEGRVPGWNKLSETIGLNRGWSKGLTMETDSRIKARPELHGKKFGNSLHGHTEESKEKLRKKRLSKIAEGHYDSSGRKGHRGHYQGLYFHSSWELAFYVYQTEVLKNDVKRNSTTTIKYQHNKHSYTYIPDFIVNGQLVEVKGYLFGERDQDKFNQSKDLVRYVFKDEMAIHIKYCIQKYGKLYWKKLYGEMEKLVNS